LFVCNCIASVSGNPILTKGVPRGGWGLQDWDLEIWLLFTLKGDILHSITVENETIEEIYDVAFVPGVKHMMIGGLHDDLSEQMITVAPLRK
jgi:hypothetical protein